MSNQVQKISQSFLVIFRTLLIVIPIMVLLQWFFIDVPLVKKWVIIGFGFFDPIITENNGSIVPVHIAEHAFSLTERWIGLIGTCVGLLPLFLALFVLIPVFKNYCTNHIFS